MIERQVDILIVGGGLTGAILLLALADKGYSVLLVDANPLDVKTRVEFDARTLALSPASLRILQMLNLWPLLQSNATAIETIHVSEQRRFGRATIKSESIHPLGYVVEMQRINQVLYQLLDKQQILAPAQLTALDSQQGLATITTDKKTSLIKAKLIVAADGTHSTVRKLSRAAVKIKDYQQHAIVTNIGLARSHRHQAYERFTSSGPLALLPMSENRAALVWALTTTEAKRLMAVEEVKFLNALQQAFGYRLGRFMRVGKRVVYPLKQVIMPKKAVWPLVFVGNAAHTLHPVAGQGFNLGLRDVATLAQCIVEQGLSAEMLQRYQYMRQHDELAITRFADGLIEVFTSQLPGMAFARSLGLMTIDNVKIIKQCLTHYTRGFAGVTPDLVCGIALKEAQ